MEVLYESDDISFIKQKEIEFIQLYGRLDNKTGILVNHTDGGGGISNPSNELKNKTRRKVGKDNNQSKKVYQYTLKGVFVKTHDSVASAAKQFGMNRGVSISFACKNKGNSCKGFYWFYEYQGEQVEPRPDNYYLKNSIQGSNSRKKKIAKLSKESGEVLETFDCTMDITRKYEYSNSLIVRVALGKKKSAYGFKWAYTQQ